MIAEALLAFVSKAKFDKYGAIVFRSPDITRTGVFDGDGMGGDPLEGKP